MKKKWTELIEKYGKWVFIIYLTTFVVTFGSVFILLQVGFKDSVVAYFIDNLGEEYASAGSAVLAYAITKATQPIRIAITILVVPLVARISNPASEKYAQQ
jgi:type IV secretory pathway TraG/TraD family ATPase VirD4